jgi:hypothetical protein
MQLKHQNFRSQQQQQSFASLTPLTAGFGQASSPTWRPQFYELDTLFQRL